MKGDSMVVNQKTFTIKSGKFEEAIAHLKDVMSRIATPLSCKIYKPLAGQMGQLIFETQHEDMAGYERDWERFVNDPVFGETIAAWQDLNESGHFTNYLFEVETL
jgi:hypothetical protein